MINQSDMLELGKAGEHLALFEIICQGYKAFLSDQGMVYDIVVDVDGRLIRGQVKSTIRSRDYGKSKNICRFSTRRAKKGARSGLVSDCDFYALVCLSTKQVGFLSCAELESNKNHGQIKQCVEVRTNCSDVGRSYSNGTERKLSWGLSFREISDLSRIFGNEAPNSIEIPIKQK